MEVTCLPSALRHGITEQQIRYVIENSRTFIRTPPPHRSPAGLNEPRQLYLGDDEDGIALEVMAVPLRPEGLLVIHAMGLRGKFQRHYREMKQWHTTSAKRQGPSSPPQ